MIIPCIKSTSFGEGAGRVPRVEAGSDRVGWPGAPGWTTTGACGSCRAQTGRDTQHARATAAKDAFRLNPSSMEGFTLSQSRANLFSGKARTGPESRFFRPQITQIPLVRTVFTQWATESPIYNVKSRNASTSVSNSFMVRSARSTKCAILGQSKWKE